MNLLHITRKELASYLTSSMSYLMLGIFLLLTGYMHWSGLKYFAEYSAQAGMDGPLQFSLNDVLQSLFENYSVLLTFIIPLMTMRLMAEEQKQHTLEFLLASPASTFEIVMGKFLAAMAWYSVMLAITSFYPLSVTTMATLDYGPILSGYFGFLLLGAGFVSVGLFASSMTQHQMVAGLIGFAVLLMLYLLSWLSSTGGSTEVGWGIGYFSISEHLSPFVKGLLRSTDVVYWLSLTFVFLLATHQRTEALRYR